YSAPSGLNDFFALFPRGVAQSLALLRSAPGYFISPLRGFWPRPSVKQSSQVLDLDRLDLVCEREAEDARVEVQLSVEGALDVLGLAEAVLLALECDVGDGQTLPAERLDHQLGLVRRDAFVFEALKEDDGAREAFGEVDRGALEIQIRPFGIRADEAVEVARL